MWIYFYCVKTDTKRLQKKESAMMHGHWHEQPHVSGHAWLRGGDRLHSSAGSATVAVACWSYCHRHRVWLPVVLCMCGWCTYPTRLSLDVLCFSRVLRWGGQGAGVGVDVLWQNMLSRQHLKVVLKCHELWCCTMGHVPPRPACSIIAHLHIDTFKIEISTCQFLHMHWFSFALCTRVLLRRRCAAHCGGCAHRAANTDESHRFCSILQDTLLI